MLGEGIVETALVSRVADSDARTCARALAVS